MGKLWIYVCAESQEDSTYSGNYAASSGRDFGAVTNTSLQSRTQWKQLGTSADPALSTVYKLALALEVPPSLLLPESGEDVSSICTTTGTRAALMRIQAGKAGDGEGGKRSHLAAHLEGLEPFSREYTDHKRGEVKAKKTKGVRRAINKTA